MSYGQRQARKRRRGGARSGAVLVLAVFIAISALIALSGVGYVIYTAASTPSLDELDPIDKGASSEVFAADGSRLGYVQSDTIRTPIPAREMTDDVKNATVAIEDERFYEHNGVDFEAIVRAGIENLSSGDTVQGGSTITQQLVRALYIKDAQRNFERKIREARLASEFEKRHDKPWILREYLNSVPYGTVNGRTAIGIEAAASVYFAKHAKDLRLHEAALLAGLPQAPSQNNPLRNPTAALERRNEVLARMVKNRLISQDEADLAASRRLGLRKGTRYTRRREPYFFDFVSEQLIERYGVGVFRRGGLKVHTTIDPKLQEAGRQAIESNLGAPDDPSSAIVAIDPSTGFIKTMASSGTYKDRTFNLAAQGHRQPGSAFKTFVLTAAIRKGVNPQTTTYTSRPLSLNVPGYGPWKVQTYDKSYGGSMDLVRATLKSDNTVYAQLDVDVGPKYVRDTAKRMGITTKLDGIPSEGLGGLRLGVSPLEMANAYATLASGGIRSRPKAIKRVVFPDGKSENLGKPRRKRVLTDGVAAEVTKILQKNIQAGTGTKANIGCPAAGKTGTTDNFNDAWFAGYTPALAAAVWVGYPNALREMRSVHGISVAGGTFPAQIWGNFMKVAKNGCRSFPRPSEPVKWRPFTGRKSQSGGSPGNYPGYGTPGSGPYNAPVQPGTGGNSAGGQNYRGYDPRVYETPPQQAPPIRRPPSPTPTPSPTPGGGNRVDGGPGGGEPGGGGPGGGGGDTGGGAPPPVEEPGA